MDPSPAKTVKLETRPAKRSRFNLPVVLAWLFVAILGFTALAVTGAIREARQKERREAIMRKVRQFEQRAENARLDAMGDPMKSFRYREQPAK